MRAFLLGFCVIAMSCARSIPSGEPVDAPRGSGAHDAPAAHDGPAGIHDSPGATGDASFACKPANILHGDGHHNPGQDCMGSCHDHGFSLAGTLYLADGVTPASDATVTVVDANNNSQDIIASTNGNFFSFLPVAYPVRIRASLCPTVQVMISQATAGSCNSSACHGGAQGFAHL